MTKTNDNGNLNFHATVPTYLPPSIVDTFTDDSGEVNFVLSNGRTTLETAYNQLWRPVRGKINTDKGYKGENKDTTKIK